MDLSETIYTDRSERAKLRFTGEQRAWFLHQIMTQAFEDIAPGEARDAVLLTHHGRMVGYMETLATEDAILAHFEPELRSSFAEAIGRYVFATRVEITDVTEDMGLMLVAGPRTEEMVALAPAGSPIHRTRSLGVDASYVWVSRAGVKELVAVLDKAGCRAAPEEELEAIRIANGIPRWGRDMTEKTLPQEARLEGGAVHLDKGCYVGQEAVAKIHFRGKVNRLLRRIEIEGAVEAGAEVMLDGDRVGVVTSAAGERALAMLKHRVEPGTTVQIGDVKATVVE
ncbi:MAG: YgfZ/GcvT domain-containing protein [Actinomycetota bacterium]